MTALQAIRKKCRECSGGGVEEVRECVIKSCALYPFRFGNHQERQKNACTGKIEGSEVAINVYDRKRQ